MRTITIIGLSALQANALTIAFEEGDFNEVMNVKLKEVELPMVEVTSVEYDNSNNTIYIKDE